MTDLTVLRGDMLRLQATLVEAVQMVDDMLAGGTGVPTIPPITEIDVRSPNANHHDPAPGESGDVKAVHLTVHKVGTQDRRYRCVGAQLLVDDDSCNIYVQVFSRLGTPIMADVRMGTGYSGNPDTFHDYIVPGNPNGSFFMGPDSGFTPPNLGPLAVMIRDGGRTVSDTVGGMGLSRGQHMSYLIKFMEV